MIKYPFVLNDEDEADEFVGQLGDAMVEELAKEGISPYAEIARALGHSVRRAMEGKVSA